MAWLIGILFFVSFTVFILAFARPKAKEDVSQRMQRLQRQVGAGHELPAAPVERPARRLWSRAAELVAPVGQLLVSARAAEKIAPRLRQAGWYDATPAQFASWQLLGAVGGALLFLFIFYIDRLSPSYFLPGLIGALALGYYYPRIKLNTAVERRQKEILRALPDVLDLLTVCIEAGMGLNAALQKVVEQIRPSALVGELQRTLQEVKVGRPRADALRGLAQRVELRDLTAVVLALVQAEQIGTPLGKTLRQLSETVRQSRWQRAQEMAQKAPVKMVLPVVLLIFPVMFLVIFGPIVLNLLVLKR